MFCVSVHTDNKPPEVTNGVFRLVATAGVNAAAEYEVSDPDDDDIITLELKVYRT